MQQLSLHPQGPVFSRIVAGAWRWNSVSSDVMERLISTALDAGIDTFDHADIYGDYSNEQLFGDVVKKHPALLKSMKLVSKCGIKLISQKKNHRIKYYDTSKEHVIASAENSLKLLGTDHLDLLLIHRPDPLMNASEVSEAFAQLRQQGKVLHFGVSNFTPSQFDLLQSHLPFALVTNQIEISLFNNSPLFDGSLDHLYQLKTSAMAWSPLGGGKQMHGELVQKLHALKAKYNATESQLLYAWLLKHPSAIFPVIGTTQPERITEAVKALDIKLEREDWFEMLQIARGKEVA